MDAQIIPVLYNRRNKVTGIEWKISHINCSFYASCLIFCMSYFS